jgi:glutathione S-transferase kappa 1
MRKATEKEWKGTLTSNTKTALDKGAFGAPWIWVTNAQGVAEPFFGSDRFHFMWEFLGLAWEIWRFCRGARGRGSRSFD